MLTLEYSNKTLNATLDLLRKGGELKRECVVLWLGRRAGKTASIECVYLPGQTASADMFHIPPVSMRELMAYLKQHRLMVAAQVHTHPLKAFHSVADDQWAFVRHQGAISMVLPYFAETTTANNYWDQAETYVLSSTNNWEHTAGAALRRCLRETQ